MSSKNLKTEQTQELNETDDSPSKEEEVRPVDNRYHYYCHDVLFAILFLALFIVTLYYGFQGVANLTGLEICDQVAPNAPEASAQFLYDGCIHHMVVGSSNVYSECIAFTIAQVFVGQTAVEGLSVRSQQLLEDNREDMHGFQKGNAHALQLPIPSLPSEIPIDGSLIPDGTQDFIEAAYRRCLEPIITAATSNDPNGAIDGIVSCLEYALDEIVGGELPTNPAGRFIDECVVPVSTASRDTLSDAFIGCGQYGMSQFDEIRAQLPSPPDGLASQVFMECVQDNTDNPSAAASCIYDRLGGENIMDNEELNRLRENECVDRTLSGDSSAPSRCLQFVLTFVTLPDIPSGDAIPDPVRECVGPVLDTIDFQSFDSISISDFDFGAVRECAFTALLASFDNPTEQLFGLVQASISTYLEQSQAGSLLDSGQETLDTVQNVLEDPFVAPTAFLEVANDLRDLTRPICIDLTRVAISALSDLQGDITAEVIVLKDQFLVLLYWTMALCLLVSVLFIIGIGVFAKKMIKITMVLTVLNLLVLSIINFAFGNFPGAIFLLVYMLFKIGWYFWIRNDIAFAVDILKTSLLAIKASAGPFIASACIFILQGVWLLIFAGAYYELNDQIGPSSYAILILSFFWTLEVLKNILSVIISTVVAAWYYRSNTKEEDKCPTLLGLMHACSTSFGPICLGSLIVAALRTFHYLFKKAENTERAWLKAMILCCLRCMINVLQTFNMFAFVQVAAYGKSYCGAARDTLKVVKQTGLQAVINDDLIDGVLDTCKLVAALTIAGIVGAIARNYYDFNFGLIAVAMIASFIAGYAVMLMATSVVHVSSATVFICFAMSPMALERGHPKAHAKLVMAWRKRGKPLPRVNAAGAGGGEHIEEGVTKDTGSGGVEFQDFLHTHSPLKMYGKDAGVKMLERNRFKLDVDGDELVWGKGDERRCKFGDMISITQGATTESLMKHVKPANTLNSFAIKLDNPPRELSFECQSQEEATKWVNGLQAKRRMWKDTADGYDSDDDGGACCACCFTSPSSKPKPPSRNYST